MANGQLAIVVRHIHKLAEGAGVEDLGDGPLLDRFLNRGEEEAFAALVRRHGPMVLGVCRRVLRDAHAAEDAFQATFLVLVRKARTLDRRGSVAGWLYAVAYHVALKARAEAARRRRRERQAPAPHEASAPPEIWADLQPVLDEELNRLPEAYRAAVVLCYLQGKTNSEAARLLGWPVGTVKGRLARARAILRARLTRRGVTLAAAAPTVALPGALVHATVRAAVPAPGTVAAASTSVVALAEGAMQTMCVPKFKLTAALLLVAGLVTLAVGTGTREALAQRRPDASAGKAGAPATPPKDMPVKPSRAGKPAAGQPQGQELTVNGRVLGQDKKGLAGATVTVVAVSARSGGPPHTLGQARTDRDGSFRLKGKSPAGPYAAAILATARGYGLGWQPWPPAAPVKVEIELRPEVPLRIRLIDLQGQPAAGVKVHVTRLGGRSASAVHSYSLDLGQAVWGREEDDFDDPPGGTTRLDSYFVELTNGSATMALWKWVADGRETRDGLVFPQVPQDLPGWPAVGTTDAQGRAVVNGIAADQAVGLQIRDDRFALQGVDVPPRDPQKPAEITRVLAPVRVLEGTVTDAATGKPLPHARVKVYPPNNERVFRNGRVFLTDALIDWTDANGADARGRQGFGTRYFSALTVVDLSGSMFLGTEDLPPLVTKADAQGRFRLTLFRAGSYTLRVAAARSEPYLQRTAQVDWPQEAVVRKQLDVALTPGVRVRGKVTEGAGGKGVAGARVDFWTKSVKLPAGVGAPRPVSTGKDGTFQAMLPAGRWHLVVNGPQPVYLSQKLPLDQVAEARDAGLRLAPGGNGKEALPKVVPAEPRFFHPDTWAAVDLQPGADREVHFALKRAPVLRGRVVGADGKALAKVRLVGRPAREFEGVVYQPTLVRRLWLDLFGQAMPARDAAYFFDPRGRHLTAVELTGGAFEIPVFDPAETYRLHFLDAANRLGGVAELKGKQAGGAPVTVRLEPCGSARLRVVDDKGKPLAGHQPALWLLAPRGPRPARKDALLEGPAAKYTVTAVRAGEIDPTHHGKGPRTDAEGRVVLPALIPGATYRIGPSDGPAREFTVRAGQVLELPDLRVAPPALKGKAP